MFFLQKVRASVITGTRYLQASLAIKHGINAECDGYRRGVADRNDF